MVQHDAIINFGEEERPKARFAHPVTVLFHLLFRVGALLTYLLCSWFTTSFIISFLIVLFFLSLDFWTVKNISGRLLAGLRWWNFVDQQGNSHWRFESRKDTVKEDTVESRIFWLGLIVCPIVWVILFMIDFFTFKWQWLTIVLLGLAMNGTNLYGYIRCKWSSRTDMSNYLTLNLFTSLLRRAARNPNPQ